MPENGPPNNDDPKPTPPEVLTATPPDKAPKNGPQTSPKTGPQIGPKTGPQIDPETGPNIGHQTGPHFGSQSDPLAGPQNVPSDMGVGATRGPIKTSPPMGLESPESSANEKKVRYHPEPPGEALGSLKTDSPDSKPSSPKTPKPGAGSDDGDGQEGQEEGLSFLDHLAELRRRLIACLIAVGLLTLGCWNFAGPILDLIMRPVLKLLPNDSALVYTGLPDAFSVTFKVSLWAGAILAAPFCFFQLWAFVAPGLRSDEKAKVPGLTILATVLFLAGVAFAYFLAFPITFGFFLKFSSTVMKPLLTVDRYMSLVMSLALAFALSFQLPLVLTFLSRLGIVSPAFLKKQRPYAIVLIFILAAVLTPPDVISQIILAAALMALYELSIFLVQRETKLKEKPKKLTKSS